jgi:hypothetical protein
MKMKSLFIATILAISLGIVSPSEAQAPLQSVKLLSVKQMAKKYAKEQLSFRGYHPQDWKCLNELWTRESHWNHKADNKQSSAFGIAQKLNEKSKDYVTQINNGLRYIEHRYGSPCNAWTFWQKQAEKKHGWY